MARATMASSQAGMDGSRLEGAGAALCSTACMMVAIVPSNGRLPVSSWNSTIPDE